MILQTTTGSLELPLTAVTKIEALPDSGVGSRVAWGVTKAVNPNFVQQALENAADAEGLPAAFVRSVARTESGYNQSAASAKGAIGLMQLMPTTAMALGVEPTLLEANAQGGAKYLRKLLIHYNGNAVLALAAYNAGPSAVSKYGGVPPYAETRQYVKRVLREYARQQRLIAPVKPLVARATASGLSR